MHMKRYINVHTDTNIAEACAHAAYAYIHLVYIHTRIHTCVHMYAHAHMCLCIQECVCMQNRYAQVSRIRICLHAFVCLSVSMYSMGVCMYSYMYVCVYTSVCMYIYIQMCSYTCTCISVYVCMYVCMYVCL